MRPKHYVAGVAVPVLVAGAAFAGAAFQAPAPVVQPIAFNHQRHVQEDLACADCHGGVEQGPYATIPTIQQCLLCHSEPQGRHPDEPKIREYAEQGKAIPWIRVNRLPGHVYFSHQAHVRWAKLDCADCHGDMKQAVAPVTRPQIDHLDMAACMRCHEERGASLDCVACHK